MIASVIDDRNTKPIYVVFICSFFKQQLDNINITVETRNR